MGFFVCLFVCLIVYFFVVVFFVLFCFCFGWGFLWLLSYFATWVTAYWSQKQNDREVSPFDVGLVVKASSSRTSDPRFESLLHHGDFSGSSHTSDLALQWLPCQATGVIGLALGLVGPTSLSCDWMRWKV